MKIAIYSRKSKFTGKGDSVENQIQMCKEYISIHFPSSESIVFEDEGFSGGNTDRPQFQKMIEGIKKGNFDVLVCYRLDRISRSIVDFSSTMEILEENDVAFVSIKEQFDTSTPMGRAMMYISSVFAQLERETIAERIKDNMMRLARTGRWLGGKAPTGFKGERESYFDDKMQKRSYTTLIPIEKELQLVKTLFGKYIEFDSISKLHTWTLENNIKSKNGNDFDMAALKIILTNPVYVKSDQYLFEWFESREYDIANKKDEYRGNGIFLYNKYQNRRNKAHKIKDISEQVVVVGKHKGIIDSKPWVQVQEMLEKNSKKAPRTGTGEHGVIGPILYCSCGSKMRITLKYVEGEVKHYYYKCRRKEQSKGTRCSIKNANGTEADMMIENAIKAAGKKKGPLWKQIREQEKKVSRSGNAMNSQRENIESQIEKNKKSIENLTVQLTENQSSTASRYIIMQIEQLDNQINELKKKLSSIEEEKDLSLLEEENKKLIMQYIDIFNKSYDNTDIFEKRRVIQFIFKRITWDGEHLDAQLR